MAFDIPAKGTVYANFLCPIGTDGNVIDTINLSDPKQIEQKPVNWHLGLHV
jgi:hypothetical protein